jgi:hypothetical protein
MHPQNLVGLKDLMAHIYQKFGPEAVILEVVQDPDGHDQGCGCMECMEGAKYTHEFYEDEDDYEGPGEMHREEHAEAVSNDMTEQMGEMVEELRQASETHANQAERLQNIAAALKSVGG